MQKQSFNAFWKGKRVFLTGHSGFKGSWLSFWLTEMGAEVYGYSLNPPTSPSAFEILNLKGRIVSEVNDVLNLDGLKKAIRESKADIAFHLAAQPLVRESYSSPVETFAVNAMGTCNFLEALRYSDTIRSSVLITTDKCYENREWSRPYREEDALGGYDPYSASKACSELVVSAYRRSFFNDSRFATARAGNVIGGGDWAKDRLIPDAVRSITNQEQLIVRSPESIRPWQHVLESLYGYLLLAQCLYEQPKEYAEAWNFGPSEADTLTVRQVLDIFTATVPQVRVRYEPSVANLHEAKILKLDSTKAIQKLSWSPQWGVEDALKKTGEWYLTYLSKGDLEAITVKQLNEYMEKIK